jgi:hypothetical protein
MLLCYSDRIGEVGASIEKFYTIVKGIEFVMNGATTLHLLFDFSIYMRPLIIISMGAGNAIFIER